MPVKPMKMMRIMRPTPDMMRHARGMAIAKAESEKARALGTAHILAQEAELDMYANAKNLSEDMWKYYHQKISLMKKPSKRMLKAREQAETDFMLFSQKHDTLKRIIRKKMAPTRNLELAGRAERGRWN